MAKLEDLKQGAAVRGVLADCLAENVGARRNAPELAKSEQLVRPTGASKNMKRSAHLGPAGEIDYGMTLGSRN